MYKPSPALAPLLYIPGMIYRAGICLRNRAYDAGFISARNLLQPVISVGNLTTGGTGKTPFVIYLSGLLMGMGYEAAILTRGYGRRKSGKTIILPPGEGLEFSVSRMGDEPMLIRRLLTEAWLGISSDRFCAAGAIKRHKKCVNTIDRLIFVLDDGFQHRSIHRDIDIVLIDPAQLSGNEQLLPLGILREPAAELRRAHIVIINGTATSNLEAQVNSCADPVIENMRKYAPDADFFHCIQRIRTIIPFSAWLESTTKQNFTLPTTKAFLVAAIGNPGRFMRDIKSLGIEVRGYMFFRDHAPFGDKNWKTCIKAAQKVKAESIIVTEKDAVKILNPPDFPLLVAVQSTEITESARFCETLQRFIKTNPDIS